MPYGLVGSSPLQQHDKLLHTLLMESVKTQWPNYCSDPPVMDEDYTNDGITFWDVDAPNSNDLQMQFELMPDVRDMARRPLGWDRIPITGYVNIHTFVRGGTVEYMPPDMIKIVNAIEHMIEKERKNLIPYSEYVTMDRSMEVPMEDKNQDRWHWYCSIMIGYTMLVT
jgi:hypothetical protein